MNHHRTNPGPGSTYTRVCPSETYTAVVLYRSEGDVVYMDKYGISDPMPVEFWAGRGTGLDDSYTFSFTAGDPLCDPTPTQETYDLGYPEEQEPVNWEKIFNEFG